CCPYGLCLPKRTIPASVIFLPCLILRHAVGFFKARHALHNFHEGRLPESAEAFRLSLFCNFNRTGFFHNHVCQLVGNLDHLVNTNAAFISSSAFITALGAEQRKACINLFLCEPFRQKHIFWDVCGLFATTQSAAESLSNDQAHGGGDVEGGHPHVHHPRQGFSRTVGVKGRQNQVPGLGCLDRYVGGFQISNLTHHDDVWVLPQEGPQSLGETEAHSGVHVDLIDALQVDFSRVFSGGNVDAWRVQNIKAGVEGNCFTGACRASHQDHALRLCKRIQV